ncbi:MAG: bifunctional diaminohydroxyphosphoribosylaminopyrimidine deaminase/5-amino-6-(5-phosphoribosylamino)uracil reductase RibD [Candidatus Latescibacterota bacterium]
MSPGQQHMRRALRLAERGRGKVSPNPLVGAVVVHGEQVVGEGAHLRVGGPHAEVHALAAAGQRARGATLYVTLEPCCHHGRTPPCTEAVLASGVRRVVCAMLDPDPRVSGRGVACLRAGGVEVEVGLLEGLAERQNEAYTKHRRQGLPWVILKLGQSLDGRIATRSGASRWITGEAARRHVHRWRSWVDAVMVGAGTVIADDPLLTVRHVPGRDPRVIVVDGRLRVSPAARVFQRPGAVLITSTDSSPAQREAFTRQGVAVWAFAARDCRVDLRAALARAAAEGITAVMLEGGAGLATQALRAGLVDRVQVYVAPCLLGQGVAAIGDLGVLEVEQGIVLEEVRLRRLGPDVLYTARVRHRCSPD